MLRTTVAIVTILSSLVLGLGRGEATASGDRRLCFGAHATQVGTRGNDRIVGTDRRDVIVAGGGNDVVWTKDGRDVVCGGGGHDRIRGEDGPDLLAGGGGSDRLDGGLGADHSSGGPGNDELTSPQGADTLVGEDGDDVLTGGSYLFGGPGNDFLRGRHDDSDKLFGGSGDDTMDGGSGFGRFGLPDIASYVFSSAPVQATLTSSGSFEDFSATGEGSDRLFDIEGLRGSRFDDTLTGNDGTNFLYGFDGDDALSGLGGFDTIDGGSGDDTLDGGPDPDTATFASSGIGVVASIDDGSATGDGIDTLAALEHLTGSHYDDRLTGDDGPNSLYGSFGSNELFGLAGDDQLSRGGGDAGPGDDTCFMSGAANCERHIAAAPPLPHPYVLDPQQGSALDASSFVRVAGGFFGEPPPHTREVLVSLRLLTEEGCRWWSSQRRDLVVQACERPLYNEVPLQGQGSSRTWELRVTKPLPAGIYLTTAKLPRTHAFGCDGVVAPGCIEFQLR